MRDKHVRYAWIENCVTVHSLSLVVAGVRGGYRGLRRVGVIPSWVIMTASSSVNMHVQMLIIKVLVLKLAQLQFRLLLSHHHTVMHQLLRILSLLGRPGIVEILTHSILEGSFPTTKS